MRQAFRFGAAAERQTSLDARAALIDWSIAESVLAALYPAPKGEKAWPPLAMFKALLLAAWHDLSDVALADASPLLERFSREAKRENRETGEALEDRAERIPQAEFLNLNGLDLTTDDCVAVMNAVADGAMRQEKFAWLIRENIALIKPPLKPRSGPGAGP